MKNNTLEIKSKITAFVRSVKERHFNPQTAYEQLMVQKTIVWSWGAYDFSKIKDDALLFKVNGALHKGFVIITLGFMDTYDIHLLDCNGEQVGETLRDIYCDCLTVAIDELVETPI